MRLGNLPPAERFRGTHQVFKVATALVTNQPDETADDGIQAGACWISDSNNLNAGAGEGSGRGVALI